MPRRLTPIFCVATLLSCSTDPSASAPHTLAFTSVSAAPFHTCALSTGGLAFCWGVNDMMQLGPNATYNQPLPMFVDSGLAFESIAAGRWHTCALTPSGAAWCWGAAFGANWSGSPLQFCAGLGLWCSREPVEVPGGRAFVSVAAGQGYTCAVEAPGSAFCWGANDFGQLGTGTRTAAGQPEPVTGGLRFSAISTGLGHACGVSESGEVYCWGSNRFAQLGNTAATLSTCDTTPCALQPVLVGLPQPARSVFAGLSWSCAALIDGRGYCWGYGLKGQLGTGLAYLTPQAQPLALDSSRRFTGFTGGVGHTCGLATDGMAYCWGVDAFSVLGAGPGSESCLGDPCRRNPAPVVGGHGFRSISGSGYHNCGMGTDGTLYCWGIPLEAVGTLTTVNEPVAVPTPVACQAAGEQPGYCP